MLQAIFKNKHIASELSLDNNALSDLNKYSSDLQVYYIAGTITVDIISIAASGRLAATRRTSN